MNTEKVNKKKSKFAIFSVVQRLFSRHNTELETLLLKFMTGNGLNDYAKMVATEQQVEYWRLKEVERQRLIKEKFDFLDFKKEHSLKFDDGEEKAYNYVKFLVERNS